MNSLSNSQIEDAPIGIFDSGVGGLTVAKAISLVLPNESLLYYGDTAHLPYGEKSPEAIIHYSLGIAEFLIEKGAKCLVIACNSASANAKEALERTHPNIPIYNVVDPVAQWIGQKGFSPISVLGTRATTHSGIYPQKIKEVNSAAIVNSLSTPLLVPLIEEGLAQSKISTEVLNHYLQDDRLHPMEALVLGCTHYPLLKDSIQDFLGQSKITLVDSPQLVAHHVSEDLSQKNLLATSKPPIHHQFYVSDYTDTFQTIARFFFGENIPLEERNIW